MVGRTSWQHVYFQRKLRWFKMALDILTNFYHCAIESILEHHWRSQGPAESGDDSWAHHWLEIALSPGHLPATLPEKSPEGHQGQQSPRRFDLSHV